MYYVYALYCKTGNKIYIGQTNNLEARLRQHNAKAGHHYTAITKGEWQIIYSESAETRSEALKRERQLKSARGRQFIKNHIPA